jgi:hypothetical protein
MIEHKVDYRIILNLCLGFRIHRIQDLRVRQGCHMYHYSHLGIAWCILAPRPRNLACIMAVWSLIIALFPLFCFGVGPKMKRRINYHSRVEGGQNQNNVDDNLLASNIVHVIMVLISRQRM